MSMVYTLSTNFFIYIGENEYQYLGSVLSPFTNSQSPYKLAVDIHCEILEQYKAITTGRKFADIIKGWLDLLSNLPCSIQKYNVDISSFNDSEDKCLEICSRINGRRTLIIHSSNTFSKELDETNSIAYNGKIINVIDKDEARLQLNNTNITNISHSMVAGGDITKSANS